VSAPPPEGSPLQGVRGERAAALVHGTRSVQSRLGALLASALTIALGLAALSWYYAHAYTRPAQARRAAQATAASRAQGEMPLPAIGPIEPPRTPAPPLPGAPQDLPLAEGPARDPDPSLQTPGVAPAPAVRAGVPLPRARRLAGVVFTRASSAPAAGAGADVAAPNAPEAHAAGAAGDSPPHGAESIEPLLRAPAGVAARAQILPDLHLLLPRGAFIDCTLETAIDSTLPGMTTCITAADTFSADGTVVLLERGTKLVGETRGQVQQGQARVFVLWTEARTPTGVIVPLDSPGTDELGRSGLSGQVERHFWERFGAALLVSLVDGAVQAGVQSASHGNGAVIYAPGASQDVATEVLKDTLRIAPTVVKHNGDRIEVLVARDVDFRTVYELAAPIAVR